MISIEIRDHIPITQSQIQECIMLLPKKFHNLECRVIIGNLLRDEDYILTGVNPMIIFQGCIGHCHIRTRNFYNSKGKVIDFTILEYPKVFIHSQFTPNENLFKINFVYILFHELYHAYQYLTNPKIEKCPEPPAYRFSTFWTLLYKNKISRILDIDDSKYFRLPYDWKRHFIEW